MARVAAPAAEVVWIAVGGKLVNLPEGADRAIRTSITWMTRSLTCEILELFVKHDIESGTRCIPGRRRRETLKETSRAVRRQQRSHGRRQRRVRGIQAGLSIA